MGLVYKAYDNYITNILVPTIFCNIPNLNLATQTQNTFCSHPEIVMVLSNVPRSNSSHSHSRRVPLIFIIMWRYNFPIKPKSQRTLCPDDMCSHDIMKISCNYSKTLTLSTYFIEISYHHDTLKVLRNVLLSNLSHSHSKHASYSCFWLPWHFRVSARTKSLNSFPPLAHEPSLNQ